MQRSSRQEISLEIDRAETAITAATGQRPSGYRGPAFSWSPVLLEVLAERGYRYDASTLPTYLGPMARAYFLATARLDAEERRRHRDLFGSFHDGRRPVKPYLWRLPTGRNLLEIPVTTIPGIKMPFHMSYLIYLSQASRGLMRAYLRTALQLCLRAGVSPSFLLHPLDFLGPEHAPELTFFPGMSLSGAHKRSIVREVIVMLAERFTLVPISTHAAEALALGRLAVLEPEVPSTSSARAASRAQQMGLLS
jgi:hypothetical protein